MQCSRHGKIANQVLLARALVGLMIAMAVLLAMHTPLARPNNHNHFLHIAPHLTRTQLREDIIFFSQIDYCDKIIYTVTVYIPLPII